VCSQLLEAASIFEMCDLSCTELLKRLERVERAGPCSDLVEYFHTFADDHVSTINRYISLKRFQSLFRIFTMNLNSNKIAETPRNRHKFPKA
jgi:hypothetical protein